MSAPIGDIGLCPAGRCKGEGCRMALSAAAPTTMIALAPPRVGAGLQDRQQVRWPIRLATVVAVAIAAWIPLLQLYRIVTTPVDRGSAGWVMAATLLSMPVQVWLVWSA